ncbi:MAG: hypothetical protein JWL76_721 [Thermoleophilia bacterium]|nr:hypothetical protein [Thermoleophilia bacterium]
MPSRPFTRPAWVGVTLAMIALCCLAAMSGTSAPAATAPLVVSMAVPSAVTLTNSCTNPGAYRFGTVQPGTPATTTTTPGSNCRFGFASSNDSAMLRIGSTDASGTAMNSGFSSMTGGEPDPDAFTGVATSSASTAYAVRHNGQFYRSTDAGPTWATRGPGVPNDPAGVTAPYWIYDIDVVATDPLRVWAVGSGGHVYRSVDGGLSWERITATSLAGMDVTDVAVVDGNTVFVAGYSGTAARVLRTSTGSAATAAGVTWDIDSALPGTPTVTGLAAADSSNVWVANGGGVGVVLRSTNGGSTWGTLTVPGVPNQLVDVDLAGASTAVVVGQGGIVRYSTNATAATPGWTNRDTGDLENFRTVSTPTASTWFAAGLRGSLYRTMNAGANWTRIDSPVQGPALEIDAWDDNYALLAAKGRRLASTTNGTTWVVRMRGAAGSVQLTGVASVAGTQTVVAVGEEGAIRRSTDLGVTWTGISSPTSDHLHAVASSLDDGRKLYAAGANGTVVRSVDSGASWAATAATGTASELLAVAAWDSEVAYAVGRSGAVVRTVNGGSTWQVMTPPSSAILGAVVTVGRDVVVAGGRDGLFYRTTNGGVTWSPIAPPGFAYAIRAMDIVEGTQVIWAGKEWSEVVQSMDGGVTWSAKTGTGVSNYGIAAASTDTAMVSSYNKIVGFTTDGGATWGATTFGGSNVDMLADVDAIGTDRAVTVGGNAAAGQLLPGAAMPDYDNDNVATDNDWAGANSLFGVCLQAVGGTTTPVWGVDANGTCTASDSDPWRAVPNGLDKVATTSGPGVAGQVDLVWGLRPALTHPRGTYAAHVTVEALAPNV